MVSVSEATSIILSHPFTPKKEITSLTEATGRVLAEPILADRDLPPFDRATMDGIALNSASFHNGLRSFKIQGTQAAGQPASVLGDASSCIELMTGAVLPKGADAIVRYEDLAIENGIATVKLPTLSKGDHIHFKGIDARKDQTLLSPGQILSAAEVAVAASVGMTALSTYRSPETAIVSTGDELIPVAGMPLVHQIRQSNSYALNAALSEWRARATLVHATDEKQDLHDKLSSVFTSHDLIILSGGVSKGKFDYVPQVLESLGIQKQFHQVSQKPGKPFWFGTSERHTVFALPGNPVSTFMCFYRYVRPWLLKSLGCDHSFPTAILSEDFSFKAPLTYFLQVKVRSENGMRLASPDPGGGSGDFANMKDVDGFLELPLEKTHFKKGEVFPLFRSVKNEVCNP